MDSVAALSKSLAGCGLVLALACGGGGGSEGPTPPSAPQKLTAIGVDRQVSLAWDASTGATSYNIKRGSSTGSYTQLATSTATTYRDTGLNNGTTYFYVVSALSSAGEGSNSAEVSATPSTALPLLPEDDATKNHVGMNTWFLNDWDESFAFVDAVKHARAWQDGANWNTAVGGIDDLGWPTADASTVFWTGTPAQVNGTYRLSFKGQADVSVMWYGGSVSNKIYDSATNTTTADVTISASGSGSGGLRLTNTKRTATSATNTGFTDLHLYRPGYATDGSDVFTSPFLAALGKVSVVRMMDWTATNSNLTQNWSDRRTPLHMYKAGPAYNGPGGGVWSSSVTGVALEHQIQLCNALKADFWVNIPVVADDDYVRKIALACRYGTDGTNPYTSYEANPVYPPLDPTLHVYLEYANEIWNSAGGFTCFGLGGQLRAEAHRLRGRTQPGFLRCRYGLRPSHGHQCRCPDAGHGGEDPRGLVESGRGSPGVLRPGGAQQVGVHS
ncbi:MAG: hypothetical protein H6Q00_1874 [Holophagaceae bacterium]|nr:hypothetical protein [Holophagaceae bacterium]